MSTLTTEQETRLNQDIRATQELMLRNGGNHGIIHSILGDSPFIEQNKYESLYTNATEDMATYYKEFKNPKSILTIGASGEQVVNAINAGATILCDLLICYFLINNSHTSEIQRLVIAFNGYF